MHYNNSNNKRHQQNDNITAGESVSVTKHTDIVADDRAVNQDKTNILFSVSFIICFERDDI